MFFCFFLKICHFENVLCFNKQYLICNMCKFQGFAENKVNRYINRQHTVYMYESIAAFTQSSGATGERALTDSWCRFYRCFTDVFWYPK